MNCPACNQSQWIEGTVGGPRGDALQFKPRESKFLVLSYPAVLARACGHCGYLALATDREKLKKVLKD